jgi:hypothetical protein
MMDLGLSENGEFTPTIYGHLMGIRGIYDDKPVDGIDVFP